MKNAYPRWIFVVLAALSGCGGGGGSEPSAEPPPPIVEPPVTPPPVTVPSPGNLTGLIVVPPHQFVDGDTNNLDDALAPNNGLRIEDVQPVSNPFVVSGFVTLEGTGGGAAGNDRFAVGADFGDYYRVTLNAGQRLRLQIADWLAEERFANDIDLALYDAQGRLLDESAGLGEFEELVAPFSGEYVIGVEVFAGHSNYVLQVSDALAPLRAAQRAPRLSDPMVVGEVVAQLEESLPASALHAQGMLMRSAAFADEKPVLIQLDAPPLQLSRAYHARRQHDLNLGLSVAPEQIERREYLHGLKRLQALPGVKSASPNYWRKMKLIPNDPLFTQQWHYTQINLTPAWTQSEGEGVIVAVADTGVFLNHDDLRANLIGGYDFISDIANALDGNGIDPNPDDPGDGGRAGESSWHGTHVAGTVAAVTGNGIGIAGVAPRAQIMPIRVLGAFGGTDYDILQGMRYAAGLSNDSGTLPPRRADIINLSLGGPGFNAVAQQVIDAVRAQGVIVIAASGNENTREPSYPASYAGVVSVGAVGRDGGRAPYSNIGPTLDIVAPGGNGRQDSMVMSTFVTQNGDLRASSYAAQQGTSMATPHMAGVAALMRAIHPGLTPEVLDALISQGRITRDLGAPGRDDLYGHGLVDALLAVNEARRLATGETPAYLLLSTSLIELSAASTATFQVSAGSSASIGVADIRAGASWLSVQAQQIDGTGLGTYRLTVDRTGLQPAQYQTDVLLTDTRGQASRLSVRMQVVGGDASVLGDAGVLYVLLVDVNDPDETYAEAVASREGNAGYRFRFDNVPPGRYRLIAGSDYDNDQYVCDSGESCGAYPTLESPNTEIVVDGNRSGLDFVVTADLGISSTGLSAVEEGVDVRKYGVARLPEPQKVMPAKHRRLETGR